MPGRTPPPALAGHLPREPGAPARSVDLVGWEGGGWVTVSLGKREACKT
jgi:hypothetical protein